MELRDLIRQARNRKRMSQRALASLVGVNPSAVAQWEGGGNITSENMALVRAILDIDQTPPQSGRAPYKGELIEDPDEISLIAFWRDLDEVERHVYRKRLFRPPGRREILAAKEAISFDSDVSHTGGPKK